MKEFYLIICAALIAVALLVSGCSPSAGEVARELATMQAADEEAEETPLPPTPTAAPQPTAQTALVAPQPTAQTALVARELGPWAPDGHGQGEDFEVTANAAVTEGVTLDLWWPHGQAPWGQKEIQTFVPAGLSIEVQQGGGRGWEYPTGYSLEKIQEELEAHMGLRSEDTSHFGFVSIWELIETELVEVRFNRTENDPDLNLTPAYP